MESKGEASRFWVRPVGRELLLPEATKATKLPDKDVCCLNPAELGAAAPSVARVCARIVTITSPSSDRSFDSVHLVLALCYTRTEL